MFTLLFIDYLVVKLILVKIFAWLGSFFNIGFGKVVKGRDMLLELNNLILLASIAIFILKILCNF